MAQKRTKTLGVEEFFNTAEQKGMAKTKSALVKTHESKIVGGNFTIPKRLYGEAAMVIDSAVKKTREAAGVYNTGVVATLGAGGSM